MIHADVVGMLMRRIVAPKITTLFYVRDRPGYILVVASVGESAEIN